ncbi:MAG: hypothetical protein BWX66_01604 [Deltaproteobacteria bacterium ADurb.Bin058]|nr:MAG: hypothetical protein BWX66_01604 [Deltaproteobacteria bacterium ADurb.Bin058]
MLTTTFGWVAFIATNLRFTITKRDQVVFTLWVVLGVDVVRILYYCRVVAFVRLVQPINVHSGRQEGVVLVVEHEVSEGVNQTAQHLEIVFTIPSSTVVIIVEMVEIPVEFMWTKVGVVTTKN